MPVKFFQPPDLSPAGVDVLCLAQPGPFYRKLADDWICEVTGPVSRITFWVSFLDDQVSSPLGVHLSVHADSGAGFPGPLLDEWDLVPSQFTMTLEATGTEEAFVDPDSGQLGVDHEVWRIDCDIPPADRWTQTQGVTYWLDVTVLAAGMIGWKTADGLGQTSNLAVWTPIEAPEPPWYPILLPPAGSPAGLSFAIETADVTTTTAPPQTTAPPATTPPPTTTPPPATKFEQPPDEAITGVDVRACDNPLVPTDIRILADDWPCNQYGRLTKIWLWCSYLGDAVPTPPFTGLRLSIHDDIPVGPYTHSCPGPLLWEHVFTLGVDCDIVPVATTDGEWFWDPDGSPTFPGDFQIFRVDCYLTAQGVPPFIQEGTAIDPRVYWLDVMALMPEPGVQFGWKTTLANWNDAACWTIANDPGPVDWNALQYPETHPMSGAPIDMSFGVESVQLPSPTTTAPPTTTTTAPPVTTAPPMETHPADTGPGVPNWRCEPVEVVMYAATWLGGGTLSFKGTPLDGPGVAQAYILRAAAITLANFQARYADIGTPAPINSTDHPQRWQEASDL